MIYAVTFRREVTEEDFSEIDAGDLKRIFKILLKKLQTAPLEFGKPLSGNLQGLLRLRIGEYRVIYSVSKLKVEVLVIKIGFRRNMEVYTKTAKRLGIL